MPGRPRPVRATPPAGASGAADAELGILDENMALRGADREG
jgi:hypothetical protein